MSKKNLATGLWNHLKGAYGKLEGATSGHANAAIGSTIGGISGAVYGESGDDGSAGKSALGFIGGAAAGAALGAGAKYGLNKFKKAGAVADDVAKSEPTVAEEVARIPDPMPIHTPTPEPVKPQNRTSEEIAKMDDADFDKWVRENLNSTYNAPPQSQPKPTQVKPPPVKKEEPIAPKPSSSTEGSVPPKKKPYNFEEDMKEWERKNPEYMKKLDEIYGGDLWQVGVKPQMGKTREMQPWERYERPKKKKSMFNEDSPYRREYDGNNEAIGVTGNNYIKYTDPKAKVYPKEDYSNMKMSDSRELTPYINRAHEKVVNNLIPLKDTSYLGKDKIGRGEFFEPLKRRERYTYEKSPYTSPVDNKIKQVVGGETLRSVRGDDITSKPDQFLDRGPGTISMDMSLRSDDGSYHREYDFAKEMHDSEKDVFIMWNKLAENVEKEKEKYNNRSDFNGDTFEDSGAREALLSRLRSRSGLKKKRRNARD